MPGWRRLTPSKATITAPTPSSQRRSSSTRLTAAWRASRNRTGSQNRIWIGHPEAAAILMKLQGASTPRPLTHDLVTDMLGELGAQIVRITVTELKENTFYASITVQQNGSEVEIDSRPSDAIAIAVRAISAPDPSYRVISVVLSGRHRRDAG